MRVLLGIVVWRWVWVVLFGWCCVAVMAVLKSWYGVGTCVCVNLLHGILVFTLIRVVPVLDRTRCVLRYALRYAIRDGLHGERGAKPK